MKNRILTVIVIFVFVIALSACGKSKNVKTDASENPSASVDATASQTGELTPSPDASAETTQPEEVTESPSPSSEETAEPSISPSPVVDEPSPSLGEDSYITSGDDFSFEISGVSLTLREHDVEAKLKKLPLRLISDETEVLGEGSDTFTGSFLRTLTYDGLDITMFAPEDNSDNFWIIQMAATSDSAVSYRGIKVGDALEKLMEKYPEAEKSADDSAEIYIYSGSGDDSYAELAFTIENGAVTLITMTFFIP